MKYSLRSLMLIMLVLCLGPGGWICFQRYRVERQVGAVESLSKLGAVFSYIEKKPEFVLGGLIVRNKNAFDTITGIDFRSQRIDDRDLRHLLHLPKLSRIDLRGTGLTDDGLEYLPANLTELNLDDTLVTDSGLRHLEKLRELTVLSLSRTTISDAGAARLAQCTQLEELGLGGTKISQTGLRELQSLTRLKSLVIPQRAISTGSIARFRSSVPGVGIMVE